MSESTGLLVTREGDVTRLVLSRPERGNALSPSLVEALSQAFTAAAQDGTRRLVITGSGKHFCTGFDLSDLEAQTDDTLLARFVRIELMLAQLHAAPFATLAVAHGRVIGAGADLFAACEARWISGDASFAFPGAGFGIVLGTGRLAALVGSGLARAWVGSGETVNAQAAVASGLAQSIHAADAVQSVLDMLAKGTGRLDMETHAAIRRASLPRGDAGAAQDLAALVHSAARPGLKSRIQAYIAAR